MGISGTPAECVSEVGVCGVSTNTSATREHGTIPEVFQTPTQDEPLPRILPRPGSFKGKNSQDSKANNTSGIVLGPASLARLRELDGDDTRGETRATAKMVAALPSYNGADDINYDENARSSFLEMQLYGCDTACDQASQRWCAAVDEEEKG